MSKQQPKTDTKTSNENTKTLTQTVPAMPTAMAADPLAQLGDATMLQRALTKPGGISPKAVPGLQRGYGNKHVQRMLTGMVQRQADDTGGVALGDGLSGEIDRQTGGGHSLPDATQAKMKQNLGVSDPENIKVHTDTKSDQLSKSLGARAFTTGNDIFFQEGEYNPHSTEGQKLLFHEGWHTRQQGATGGSTGGGGSAQTKMVVNPPDDKYEQEADAVAEQAAAADQEFSAPGGAAGANGSPPATPGIEDEDAREAAAVLGQAGQTNTAQRSPQSIQRADEDKEDEPSEEEIESQKEESKDKMKDKAGESKEEGQEQGEEKGEGKEEGKEETPPPVEKESKPAPPETMDTQLPLPEPDIDSTEVKYEAEEELEEPELPENPLWDDLAAGTIQMSAEDVAVELGFRNQLSQGIEVGDEAEEAAGVEEEELDRGELIGDALAEGALEGFTEGASSFIADQVVQAATSKIPYADGFIAMAQIAHDPNQWFADNVMSIGTGAVDMVKGFAAIGDEDTAWGYMAATLEAIVGLIDLVNSIVSLINTIFVIILALSKVMTILGNIMISLAPTAPFCILCWMAAPGSMMVSIGTAVMSFLDPVNALLGAIGNVLILVKMGMQPLIMLFRILDILETKADPEKLKEKQAKLKGATKSFTSEATQQVGNRTKDAAVDGINRNMDKKDLKKAETESSQPTPKKPGETDADFETRKSESQQKFKDMKQKYESKYGEGTYAADKDKSAFAVWRSQAKDSALSKDSWDVKSAWKGVAGDSDSGQKSAWAQAGEDWKTKRQERAEIKQLEDRSLKKDPAKTADQRDADATQASHDKTSAEVAYDNAKKTSDNDLGVTLTKAKADESYQKLTKAETDLAAAQKRGDPDEIERAAKVVDDAQAEHTKNQEAWISNYNQQQENEARTQKLKDELDAAKVREQQAKDDADKARAEAERQKQWEEKVKGSAKEGWKQEWADVGGWRLGSGAFSSDKGGQRHGPGITGASSKLFDVIGFDFGQDKLREALGGKKNTDVIELMQNEEKALTDGDTTKAAELKTQIDDEVAGMDPSAEQDTLDGMKAKAPDWLRSKSVQDNIDWQQKLVDRINQVQAERGTSAMEEWAGGNSYGIKPMNLELEATGLDGYSRKNTDSTVFIIKLGRKGGVIGATAAWAGADIAESSEIKVTETSHTEEIMVYQNMRLSVVPQNVELVRSDKTSMTYEPDQANQTVETTPAAGNEQGTVKVTVPYQETSTAQTKLQRAPDETGMDPEALGGAEIPGIELEDTLDRAGFTPPASSAPAFLQRAPDDDLEPEEDPAEEMDMESDEGDMEFEEEPEEEEFLGEEPEEEPPMEETEPPMAETGDDEFSVFAMLNAGYEAQMLEMLPPPPEGVFEEMQGAALAYDELTGEEYGLMLQQQQIGGLQEHGQAQLGEVQGTRQLGMAHQQGVGQQQADAQAKMDAQNQMSQASSAQEAGAQETAGKSGGATDMLGGIFSKIMAGFGLPIPAGGGADSNSMQKGTQDQSKQAEATAGTTQQATKLSDQRMGETAQVQNEADQVQNELGDFDSHMAEEEAGTQEGLGELDEAQGINEEQIEEAEQGKETMLEQKTQASDEADAWAEEHRSIREEIFSQLEGDLQAATTGDELEMPDV